VFIDQAACETFWRAYLAQLPADHPHQSVCPDSFGFGGEPEVASELAALLLAGRKRATTSLPVEYTALGEALPATGDLSIVVRGDGQPIALIERTHVESMPFGEVGDDDAAVEGEGDGTLGYWREAHARYFASVCARLGGDFNERTRVLCQVFRVVWTAGFGLADHHR